MNEKIADCVGSLGLSVIREMGLRAAKYPDRVGLEIGEPDFHTPQPICQIAADEALAGRTHYTASQGDPELIEELRRYIKEHQGADLEAGQIVITHGGQGGLVAAMRTLVDIGDEVLMPEPRFPSYAAHVLYMGGKIVDVPTLFDDGFVLRPEAVAKAITPKSKVILLNSPNNPTGAIIPGETLDELARLVIEHDLVVVSDEVYDRMIFDGQHESIYTRPGMAERTVVVNSFSKSFAMTGWRVGFTYGPKWVMSEMVKAVSYYTVCANSIGQRAALAALRADQGPFTAMTAEYQKRVELVHDRLAGMPGVEVHRPKGTFYIFPRVAGLADDGQDFAFKLLDAEQVVVVPGAAFGPSGKDCVRLACTVGLDKLTEAMDRLERFVKSRQG